MAKNWYAGFCTYGREHIPYHGAVYQFASRAERDAWVAERDDYRAALTYAEAHDMLGAGKYDEIVVSDDGCMTVRRWGDW